MTITTLGIDIAKSVFQLHGVDAGGTIVLQRKLRRGAVLNFLSKLEPCLIGMEARATSHTWARVLRGKIGPQLSCLLFRFGVRRQMARHARSSKTA